MLRTVGLGLLIAGLTPIGLANSTVIETNNQQPSINPLPSAKTSLNLVCSKWSSFPSCQTKLPGAAPEIQSDLWLQKITSTWLSGTSLLGCLQRSPQENSVAQLFGDRQDRLSHSSQSLKTVNVLSSFSKLANPECAFTWQQQLKQNLAAVESSRSTPQSKLSNYSTNSQNYASLPKFPQLSRSSLIVSFPQENSSFVTHTSKLTNPAPATKRIASGFGWRKRPYSNQLQFHQGIDYGAPYGSTVVAAGNGIVTRIVSGCADFGNLFCGGQLGNWIEIDHGNGAIGTYGHLKSSSITIKAGMKVWKNQSIAQVGSSGWSTGAHLDFRLKVNGEYKDPAKYVQEFQLNKLAK